MMDNILTALGRLARKPAVLPFGKYKGRRLAKIVFDDPAYIGWCIEAEVKWVLDNVLRKDKEFCVRQYDDAVAASIEAAAESYWDFLDH